MSMSFCILVLMAASGPRAIADVTVTKDDTVIKESCRIVIPPGHVIEDKNGDGVIHIGADGILVTFAEGTVLRGAKDDAAPDALAGTGLRIKGRKKVTLRGLRVRGFKAGIHATDAQTLTVEDCDLSGNYRQRLRSTRAAEDGADWLYPHKNDENQWLTQHGAALCIEDSEGATVRRVRVRRGQNGILLDRVTDSKIYDNDASFLSGWGLALWRSSRNIISRNAFDFCVRGYSHGVYNRGQDSAGLLMFEQDSENVIAENSITHGGDGIFAFAGEEALDRRERKGCNKNIFLGNDLSYAAAHGLELTFSFDNRVLQNRMVGNAICGVWGGYSQDTVIARNTFGGNGEGAYGLERGGINIEHGAGNLILENTFAGDACGVHLWDDDDSGLLKKAWALANHRGSVDNAILENRFEGGKLGIHLRAVQTTYVDGNTMTGVAKEIDADEPSLTHVKKTRPGSMARLEIPGAPALGETKPVGARAPLRGREHIVMTAFGPWDHEEPMIEQVGRTGDTATWELRKMPDPVTIGMADPPLVATLAPERPDGVRVLTIKALAPGAHSYRIPVSAGDFQGEAKGTLLNTSWKVRVFPWARDPRQGEPGWLKDLAGKKTLETTVSALELKYGGQGPSQMRLSNEISAANLPADRFGTVAEAVVPLKAGTWRASTLSDDGVRVLVDGKKVIENWTWHGPTPNVGTFTVERDKAVRLLVEHFEIDGYAVLVFDLEKIE